MLIREFVRTERGGTEVKGKAPNRTWLLDSEAVPAAISLRVQPSRYRPNSAGLRDRVPGLAYCV